MFCMNFQLTCILFCIRRFEIVSKSCTYIMLLDQLPLYDNKLHLDIIMVVSFLNFVSLVC